VLSKAKQRETAAVAGLEHTSACKPSNRGSRFTDGGLVLSPDLSRRANRSVSESAALKDHPSLLDELFQARANQLDLHQYHCRRGRLRRRNNSKVGRRSWLQFVINLAESTGFSSHILSTTARFSRHYSTRTSPTKDSKTYRRRRLPKRVPNISKRCSRRWRAARHAKRNSRHGDTALRDQTVGELSAGPKQTQIEPEEDIRFIAQLGPRRLTTELQNICFAVDTATDNIANDGISNNAQRACPARYQEGC
jgi:hypothetical protein